MYLCALSKHKKHGTRAFHYTSTTSIWVSSFFSGAIFIHTFGAYFGIALSLLMRKKDFGRFSENLEGSTYNSDIFSVVGTVLLWIFWPSFNAILANHDAYHRAILNTYISLLGSTVMTFVISSVLGG